MKLFIGIVAFLSAYTWAGAAEKPKITLQADVWCPFNCEPGSDSPGYMVEIAKTAFEASGIEVEYKTTAWTRAISQARSKEIAGIIGAATSDAPDFIYPSVPLGRLNNCFYTLPDSKWTFKDVESLKQVKIGTIKGYSYGKEFDEYVAVQEKEQESKKKARKAGVDLAEKVQSVPGDQALTLNIKKLAMKRIDTFVEEENVLKSFKHRSKDKSAKTDYRQAGCLEGDDVFIAFGPNEPKGKEYAKILADTVVAMRKDGRLKKVLEKYGLKDWAN